MEGLVEIASEQLKKNGSFKLSWKALSKSRRSSSRRTGLSSSHGRPCRNRVGAAQEERVFQALMEGLVEIASEQLKKNGSFKLAWKALSKSRRSSSRRTGLSSLHGRPCRNRVGA